MSRPASRKGKKEGRKGSAKTPKKQIMELTEQNLQLTEQLEKHTKEMDEVKSRLRVTTNRLVGAYNPKELFDVFNITKETRLEELTGDVLQDLVEKLIVKKTIFEGSVEYRLAELEKRVTEITFENAKLSKKNLAYEEGLAELSNLTEKQQLRDRVDHLRLLAGQAYHNLTSPAVDNVTYYDGVIDAQATDEVHDAAKLNVMKSDGKMPGESLVLQMNSDLKLFVIQELSKEKVSGADWRLFATRVGINREQIEHWRTLRLSCPMGRVLAEWTAAEPDVSVRMLHRHVTSPDLKYIFVGRRIAEFYDVN